MCTRKTASPHFISMYIFVYYLFSNYNIFLWICFSSSCSFFCSNALCICMQFFLSPFWTVSAVTAEIGRFVRNNKMCSCWNRTSLREDGDGGTRDVAFKWLEGKCDFFSICHKKIRMRIRFIISNLQSNMSAEYEWIWEVKFDSSNNRSQLRFYIFIGI